ncbi:MAG: GNAT family N-acetyltransferase [Victivallaceae bacterium]|nr:GNAT family N-acetyltransferase [Victivallaceae bacterium]
MDFLRLHHDGQTGLYPLLGKCFPCWQPFVGSSVEFPFDAVSFAARENGVFVAHCAVVEFVISDGAGGRIPLGGLASVCTDPGFRHRGLAEKLCAMAIAYGKGKGLAGLPLFTSFQRVYEKNNWRDYPIFMPKRAIWKNPGAPRRMVPGKTLSRAERAAVAALYENGFDFPGKVVRPGEESRSPFGLDHFFSNFDFCVGEKFYAAGGGGLVCEIHGAAASPDAELFLATLPRENGATVFVLPETSPFWEKISRLATLEKADIFFHGPMVLDLDERRFFQRRADCYFPLAARF